MICTSSFKRNKNNPNAISIAGNCPLDFEGLEFKKLAHELAMQVAARP